MTIRPWVRVAALYAAGAAVNMCTGLWGPLVADLAKAAHTSHQNMGLVIGSQRLPYLLCGGLAGWLAGRIGVRNACLLGLALTAVADASNALAASAPWLIANAVIQGMGMISVVVGAQVAITGETSGKGQVRALSLWATSPVLGYALGILASSSFADGPSWRTAFGVHLIIIAIAGFLILFFAPRAPGATAEKSPNLLAVIKSEGPVLRLSLAATFGFLAASGSSNAWPTFLSALHHAPVRVVGSAVAGTMLCGIPGSLLAGWMMSAGLSSARVLIIVALAAAASGAGLYFGVGGIAAMVGEMACWFLAVGGMMAVIFSVLPRVVKDPAHLGASTGFLYQLSCIGSILGPTVFLGVAAGPAASLILTAIVILCFLALLTLTPAPPAQRRADRPVAGGAQAAG
jgi:MFS family permease